MDCHTAPRNRADDVAEGDIEGALDLPETRERVPRIPFVGEGHAVDGEEVPPLRQELVVEAPPPRVGLLVAEPRLVEFRIAVLIEELQRRVFVERQILFACRNPAAQPCAQLFHQGLQPRHDAPHIGARFRMLRPVAPHRLAFQEFRAKHGALQFHALRQKGIGVRQARNPLQQRALGCG
jgi:hypothetical protein